MSENFDEKLNSQERERESSHLITLPDNETMLDLLSRVNDSKYYIESFYPILLKNAGQEKNPLGIVVMFMLAIESYIKDVPQTAPLIYQQVPYFIDAIVIDKKLAEQAKYLFDSLFK